LTIPYTFTFLKIYREKDAVEKSFSHFNPHLEAFFSRPEERTRARIFLTVLGHALVKIIFVQIWNIIQSGPKYSTWNEGGCILIRSACSRGIYKGTGEILEKLKLKL
jgi:hypothetical protein